ncbi:MAG: hypothetical protein GX580_02485 [Candidatus Hydrogenedens sp.]|nr:thermonuclease family protein [Candidatus Hydrogenedentota bacterium]NLF56485.1 hypothetical protein [Candidatus Hydrogenedens sp.]
MSRIHANFFAIALIAYLAALPVCAQKTVSGKVIKVTDGDTIHLMTTDGIPVGVRLFGIDCPELGQDFGANAKKFTMDQCLNKRVKVMVRDTDPYGQTVGEVLALPEETNLNQALLTAGMAWWYHQHAPSDSTLEQLEKTARDSEIGLWSVSDPIPPWEWRKSSEATKDVVISAPEAKEIKTYKRPSTYQFSETPIPENHIRPELEQPSEAYQQPGFTSTPNNNLTIPNVDRPVVSPTNSKAPTTTGASNSQPTTDMVLVTPKGECYHRAGCRTLKNSQNPMERSKAIGRGYRPCRVCNP